MCGDEGGSTCGDDGTRLVERSDPIAGGNEKLCANGNSTAPAIGSNAAAGLVVAFMGYAIAIARDEHHSDVDGAEELTG